jgi:hypothetical protein
LRVGSGAGLCVAVNRHRVGDRREQGREGDRVQTRSGDIELDDIRPGRPFASLIACRRLPPPLSATLVTL